MKCPGCGSKTASRNVYDKIPPARRVGIKCRTTKSGMCVTCRRHERGVAAPTTALPSSTLLEEVEFAMEGGTRDLDRLAGWVGLSRDALTLALRRAARRGDERAVRIRSQLPVRKAATP